MLQAAQQQQRCRSRCGSSSSSRRLRGCACAWGRVHGVVPSPWTRRVPCMAVQALQGGRAPQPQPQPRPQPQPQSPPQPQPQQQRQPQGQRYALAPVPRPVFLNLSQLVGKQVITRTSGRSLGAVSRAWADPGRGQVVSLDLDEKRGLSTSTVANIPLSSLRQVGDVVLVHDEGPLYEPAMDARAGYVALMALDVRTRCGDFLGKVRDFSFSPDNGSISRITYDEFGLAFVPVNFFNCYSISATEILSIDRLEVIVVDEAKFRERKEANGVFAAIPQLLRSLKLQQVSPTTNSFRAENYLPSNYSYEQWQYDLRKWESETGMTYAQYLRSQPQSQQQQQQPRRSVPMPMPGPRMPNNAGLAPARGVQEQPQNPYYARGYGQRYEPATQPTSRASGTSGYIPQRIPTLGERNSAAPGRVQRSNESRQGASSNGAAPDSSPQAGSYMDETQQRTMRMRPSASSGSNLNTDPGVQQTAPRGVPPRQVGGVYAQGSADALSGRSMDEWLMRDVDGRPRMGEILGDDVRLNPTSS